MTDVEGSTRLWETAPEAMEQALRNHDSRLAAAVKVHGGTVIKSRGEGDSAFCVFTRTGQAAAAALEAQQALVSGNQPGGIHLRVRMAVHAGEAVERGGDFYGQAVNRCARLRAISHGGQILLTMAAAELVRDQLPSGASLRDLGEHVLRDIARPETVHQLIHPSLQADFPPLKATARRHHNLPAQLTRFIGRTREVEEVETLLGRHRLVTLVGPGGVGKTRLAIEASERIASNLAGDLWFVEMAHVIEANQIMRATASAVQVRDEPGRPIDELVAEKLASPETILALDNCEHLMPAMAIQVLAWLRAIPGLRVLATSREPLGVSGEKVFRLESLSEDQAVALFGERSGIHAESPANGKLVALICDRLDRLPLAIELAAARASSIPLDRILERLNARVPLPSAANIGASARQQTLRATVDWSYQLLEPQDRRLFRRLAIFANGFTLEGAEAVMAASADGLDVLEGIGRLVDKSLVRRGEGADGRFRYGFLQTVNEFALNKLIESSEEHDARRAHLEFMVSIAQQAVRNLLSHGQDAWLARVADEQENFRAAVTWGRANYPQLYRRLVGAVVEFWPSVGPLDEAFEWVNAAWRMQQEAIDEEQAVLDYTRAGILEQRGDYPAAKASNEKALEVWQAVGNKGRMAASYDRMGAILMMDGAVEEAAEMFDRALHLAKEVGDERMIARSTANLGAAILDDPLSRRRAADLLELGAKLMSIGGDVWGAANTHNNLGDLAMADGDYAKALASYRQSIVLMRPLGSRGRHMPSNIEGCAAVAAALEQHERAVRLASGSRALRDRQGVPVPTIQAKLIEDWVGPSKEALGPEAVAAAWKDGQEMSFDMLVDYALSDEP